VGPPEVARCIHALVEDTDNADACFVEFIKHGMLAYNQAPQILAIFRERCYFGLSTQTPNPQLQVSHVMLALGPTPGRF